jgi:hypothetical protein
MGVRLGRKAAMCLLCFGILVSQSYAQLGGPPVFLVQPVGISVQNGGTATFLAVAASSTQMSYHWYYSNALTHANQKVPDASGNPLFGVMTCTVSNVTAATAGSYWVEVKNKTGTTASAYVQLLVNLPITNVTNVLSVLSSTLTTAGFKLHMSGPPGSNYVIYASSNLVNWTAIATNSSPTGIADFTDGEATNLAFRYYRAVVQ